MKSDIVPGWMVWGMNLIGILTRADVFKRIGFSEQPFIKELKRRSMGVYIGGGLKMVFKRTLQTHRKEIPTTKPAISLVGWSGE